MSPEPTGETPVSPRPASTGMRAWLDRQCAMMPTWQVIFFLLLSAYWFARSFMRAPAVGDWDVWTWFGIILFGVSFVLFLAGAIIKLRDRRN